jgi:hypothetical protein
MRADPKRDHQFPMSPDDCNNCSADSNLNPYIKLIDLKPIISACSSEVLCKSLQMKLDEAGFENFYEVPLKNGNIKD